MELLIKALVGGAVIATVSTVSQKYPTIGAFVLGIPLASFVAFIFMYYSGVDAQTFKTISIQTIWFVGVSFLFFPIFVYTMPYVGFWSAMIIGTVVTGSLMLGLYRYLV